MWSSLLCIIYGPCFLIASFISGFDQGGIYCWRIINGFGVFLCATILILLCIAGGDIKNCEFLVKKFGEEKAKLRKEGRLIPDFDLLIGITAIHHNMKMVTNNVKHLSRLNGIQIDSWIA